MLSIKIEAYELNLPHPLPDLLLSDHLPAPAGGRASLRLPSLLIITIMINSVYLIGNAYCVDSIINYINS